MPEHSKQVLLIFELRMLGDAVLSIPFVRGATTEYKVFVCCLPGSVEIFSRVLPGEQVLPWPAPWTVESGKYGLSKWRESGLHRLIESLRRLAPDIAVSVWADARVHCLMGLSRARVRMGLPMNRRNHLACNRPWRRRQVLAGRILTLVAGCLLRKPLLTHRVNRASADQHLLENWHQLALALNIPWDTSTPWFSGYQPGNADGYQQLRQLCRSARSAGRQIWVVHPGARSPLRRWPLDRFQSLVDNVFAPADIPLIIIRHPDGPPLIPRNNNQIAVDTPTFGDLVTVTDMADCVLCNDSAAGHVGAALGKKVVSIFGPGSYEWFAPYGSTDLVVSSNACPIRPCVDRCCLPSNICLQSVTVDMVATRITRLARRDGTTLS
ncbi:MAG: glycosyltransferase family 9 protein [bacterium]